MTDLPLDIEIVASASRLAELEPRWTALWARADGSVFQSYGWIAAWWRTQGIESRARLRVAAAWRNGELVGALPLATRRYRGLRVLEWAAKDVTDYCDALVAADPARGEIVATLWDAVSKAGGWDVAYLSHLAPGSAAGELLPRPDRPVAPLRIGRRTATSVRIAAPDADAPPWFDGLSKKARQNYRRAGATLAGMGAAASFRLVGPEEPIEPILARLIELKSEWLDRTGRRSPLLERDGALLRALVAALAESGKLRLFVLEDRDGRPLAGTVSFIEHGRIKVFFITYDPAYERASVGMLILVDQVSWAFAQGLDEVDLLCGDEEFKRRLAATAVTLRSAVTARTLAGSCALALERLAESVRNRRAASGRPAPSAIVLARPSGDAEPA